MEPWRQPLYTGRDERACVLRRLLYHQGVYVRGPRLKGVNLGDELEVQRVLQVPVKFQRDVMLEALLDGCSLSEAFGRLRSLISSGASRTHI